jgi:ATP-binding cassette subfamily B multidrug efflux pump
MKASEKPISTFLRFFLTKYRSQILVGAMAIILVDLAELALPILLKRIIDSFETHQTRELIPSTLLGIGLIVVIQVICRYVWRVSLARGAMMAGADFRKDFSEQIFQVPLSLYDRKNVGDLMTLATSDVENIRMAMGPGMIALVDSIFYCIMIPFAMYSMAPDLTFKMLLPVIGIPLTVIILQKKIGVLSKRVQERIGRLGTQTQEMVAGVRLAKIYGIENRVEKRLHDESHELNEAQIALSKVQAGFGPSLEIFLSSALVIMFGLGGSYSIGTLVAMQRYLQKLMWPMSAVGVAVVYFQKAKSSAIEFFRFLEEPQPEKLSEHASPGQFTVPVDQPVIEARSLTFRYREDLAPVIQNLSFQVYPGEWLGIEGSVAAGKSTLLYLLLKFYEVERGQLFILGKDITEWKPVEVRALFSVVLQDPYLFQGSIRYNLDVGDEVEMEIALRHAEMQGRILDERLDEELGEKGSGLSGGQKQRIAIARALRKNAPVFLLDDPLSSVDIQTSLSVLSNLSRDLKLRKKTVLFVSHHPEHLLYCDRVVRL